MLLPALAHAAPILDDAGFAPYPMDERGREDLQLQVQKHLQSVRHRISRGDHSTALSEINEALAIAPDHPLLIQYAAHIYGTRGSFVLAEDCWIRLNEMDPDNDYYQIGLAGPYIRQGFTKKAEPLLIAALERNPVNVPARFNLALIRKLEKKTGEVQKLLRARSSTEVGQFASWTDGEYQSIVQLLGRRGFNEFATIVLEGKSPENEPVKDPNTTEKLKEVKDHIYRSSQAADEKDWPRTMEALNQARLAGATAPAIYQDLALYAWMNGSHEKARALLESLMTRFPGHPYIPATLGILYLREGIEAEAVLHLKAAVSADPVNAEALFALACAHAQSEENTKARLALERLQRLVKKHPALEISMETDYARALRNNAQLHALLDKIIPKK